MIRLLKVVRNRLSPPTFSSVLLGLASGLRSGDVVFITKGANAKQTPSIYVPFRLPVIGLNSSYEYRSLLEAMAKMLPPQARGLETDSLAEFRQAIADAHEEGDQWFEYHTEMLAKIIEDLEVSNIRPTGKQVFRMLADLLRNLKLIPERNTEAT